MRQRKYILLITMLFIVLIAAGTMFMLSRDHNNTLTIKVRVMDATTCQPIANVNVTRYYFPDWSIPFFGRPTIRKVTANTDSNGDAVFVEHVGKGSSMTEVEHPSMFPNHSQQPTGYLQDSSVAIYFWLSK